MSGFLGGDTDQMRQHGAACAQGAQCIVDTTEAVSAFVDSVPWLGPDAIAFRALWHGTIKPGMLAKADDIRAKGDEITQHADEQDQTSSSSDGSVLDQIRDFIDRYFGPGLSPFPPGGVGSPLTPGVIDALRQGLGDWFTGGGEKGPQEFYGDSGFGSKGQMHGQDRPVGDQLHGRGDLLPGREIDEDFGFLDVHAGANGSAGASATTDPYGNMTGTVGARGSVEVGLDERLNGPFGMGVDASGRLGAEGYAEAGGTIGPDGFSAGGRAGIGAYGETSVKGDGLLGSSSAVTVTGYAGAEAHANGYSHATRNDDGQINGWSTGFDAGAFAGAQVTEKFEATSPGGWFSGSTSISEKAGAGASIAAGQTISTDEISISVGGSLAAELGLGGSTEIALHPNAIVDTFTPGDYNLDDAISDGGSALHSAGDWVNDRMPWNW